MGLLARIDERRRAIEERNSIDWYIQNYVQPFMTQFAYNGHSYQVTGLAANQSWALAARAREVAGSLPAYMNALRRCPPAFGAHLVRALVLSQMRFTFRTRPWHATTPRRTFG